MQLSRMKRYDMPLEPIQGGVGSSMHKARHKRSCAQGANPCGPKTRVLH